MTKRFKCESTSNEVRGETMGLNAWAKRLGCNKESLRTRLNNWPLEKAMTHPFKTDHRRTARYGN